MNPIQAAIARVEAQYAQDIALAHSHTDLDPQREHSGNALILEGGGMRGIFTAGVIDVLMEHGLLTSDQNPFGSIWGVSAGAISAINVKARQIGRSMRVILAFRDDKRFMSYESLVKTGNIAGAEFMYQEVQNEIDPVDAATFNRNAMQMVAVASSVRFGTPAYFPIKRLPQDIDKVRASASLPGFSELVCIDNEPYLDGGTTDAVPFATALGLTGSPIVDDVTAAKKAVVVLTRERSYIKEPTKDLIAAIAKDYSDYPDFMRALYTRAARYNAQREQLWKLEVAGHAFIIAPDEPINLKTTEQRGEPLLRVYLQGRSAAEAVYGKLLAYLVN